VGGGASITIDGGIMVKCPGTITVHASKKSFSGPTSLSREMNTWPTTAFDEELNLLWPHDDSPVANRRFEIERSDGSIIRGTTDANGKTGLQKSDFLEEVRLRLLEE
jgi:type VI secretion system secreted protein VgrG